MFDTEEATEDDKCNEGLEMPPAVPPDDVSECRLLVVSSAFGEDGDSRLTPPLSVDDCVTSDDGDEMEVKAGRALVADDDDDDLLLFGSDFFSLSVDDES